MILTNFMFDLSFLSLILPKREEDGFVLNGIINIFKIYSFGTHRRINQADP